MKSSKINIGIVGASGLVGRTMLKVLDARNFPFNNIKLLASAKSAGQKIPFKDTELIVEELRNNSFEDLDIALFSAGAFVSKNFASFALKSNCVIIDNGSYWRMNKSVPLVVPEVNSDALIGHNGLIANPNCSTIQLVVPLSAISKLYKMERINICTYQAISGAGQKGLDKFYSEMKGVTNDDKYKIFNSVMFHSDFNEIGNTIEETKMIDETRKILAMPELKINATCVRIPVENSHSEAVNIEFANWADVSSIKKILSLTAGIVFVDDINNDYPSPQTSNGKDEIFVGRIRKDPTVENGINLWIVADNLRKGAATNAVQIAEKILENNLLKFNQIDF
jgi:aspartate-semialdehyde dehydrogenase